MHQFFLLVFAEVFEKVVFSACGELYGIEIEYFRLEGVLNGEILYFIEDGDFFDLLYELL
jgi:hypothetical protein